MKKIGRFEVSKSLLMSGRESASRRVFERMLHAWMDALELVQRDWDDGDWPWSYNERASLSIFTGAIWRSGGIAFEEYSVEKPKRSESDRKRWGRTDLYFSIGEDELAAEAKQLWLRRTKDGQFDVDRVNDELKKAVEQVTGYDHGLEGDDCLGMVFASPLIPPGNKEEVKGAVEQWHKASAAVDHYASAHFVIRPAHEALTHDQKWVMPIASLFIRRGE
jgi:hypothetical protein